MAKFAACAGLFLIMGVVQWGILDSVYAALLGAFIALILMEMRERFRRRVKSEGFCWKVYEVIDYTYLKYLQKTCRILAAQLQ